MIGQVKSNESLEVGTDMRLWKWAWQRKNQWGSWKTRVWGAGAGEFVAWGPVRVPF